MKTIDLGEKHDNMPMACEGPSTSDKEPKIWYPTVYVDDLADDESEMEVGDTVIIRGRVKSSTERADDDGEKCSYTIECLSMEVPEKKMDKSKDKAKSRNADEEQVDEALTEAEQAKKE